MWRFPTHTHTHLTTHTSPTTHAHLTTHTPHTHLTTHHTRTPHPPPPHTSPPTHTHTSHSFVSLGVIVDQDLLLTIPDSAEGVALTYLTVWSRSRNVSLVDGLGTTMFDIWHVALVLVKDMVSMFDRTQIWHFPHLHVYNNYSPRLLSKIGSENLLNTHHLKELASSFQKIIKLLTLDQVMVEALRMHAVVNVCGCYRDIHSIPVFTITGMACLPL